MTYQGTVSNGVVVFEPGVVLPEGATVSVDIQSNSEKVSDPSSKTARKDFKFEMKNGVPQFPRPEGDHPVIDLELVNRLRDEVP